jgi:hypothetical protein
MVWRVLECMAQATIIALVGYGVVLCLAEVF